MALRPLSPALASMAAKVAATESAGDANHEIDSMRFTATDLLRQLPAHFAQLAGHSELSAPSLSRTVEAVTQLRKQRAASVQQTFSQPQLKSYLRAHGQQVTGAKRVLVERIINKVWGLTADTLRARCAQAERKADRDGITMPLNREVAEQLGSQGRGLLDTLQREFQVNIVMDAEGQALRITGAMHNARAALSTLRDKLASDRMVRVDLGRHGLLRPLSTTHTSIVVNYINQAFGEAGTAVYFDSEIFARGHLASDSLDVQQALVDALTEPANSTLFVVEPHQATDAASTTIVPAVDMVSRPRSFVPRHAFYSAASPESPTSVLDSHTLFRRDPGGQIARVDNTDIVEELQKWVAQCGSAGASPNCLSFNLGQVMFDLDRAGDPLFDRLHRPSDLLAAIGQRAPLFAFSNHVSPLKWLHSQSSAAAATRQLRLEFRELEASDPQVAQLLPVYGSKLEVRIAVENGRMDFDHAEISRIDGEHTANVAILQSEHDVQAKLCRRRPVEPTAELALALQRCTKLLTEPDSYGQRQARRHVHIDTDWGRFSLVAVELDGVTQRLLRNGYAARVLQTWNTVDDLRYSSVELLPTQNFGARAPEALLPGAQAWTDFLRYLLVEAFEPASTLGA
ncbi:hypothetical protein LPJ70_003374 [Coemansia sp. RSA 2708]|nr:hypothetical protein LPJ70_003374 [Coemansia sp. RSA 2708]